MTTFSTRLICAVLSALGATGFVMFADPAIAVGSVSAKAPMTMASKAAPASIAYNG